MRSLFILLSPFLACSQVTINAPGQPSTVTINAPGQPSSVNIVTPQPIPDSSVAIFNSATESFTDGFFYTNDGVINVTTSEISYSGTAGRGADLIYDGSAFYHLYEYWSITTTVELGAMASDVDGFFIGLKSSNLSQRTGFHIKGGSTSNKFAIQAIANGSNSGSVTQGNSYTPGATVAITIIRTLRTFEITIDDGTTPITATLVGGFSPYGVTLPSIVTEFNIFFYTGTFTITDFVAKIPASKISCAFIGDSITQGQLATTYEGAYAQLLKAIFTDGQAFGGRSSKTADILLTLPAIKLLNPQRVTILMGVNDLLTGVDNSVTEANYGEFIDSLINAGIEPIILSLLPRGNGAITINNWLQSNYPSLQYINLWAALKDPSTVNMDEMYSSDGVHPNDLGMSVIFDTFENEYTP